MLKTKISHLFMHFALVALLFVGFFIFSTGSVFAEPPQGREDTTRPATTSTPSTTPADCTNPKPGDTCSQIQNAKNIGNDCTDTSSQGSVNCLKNNDFIQKDVKPVIEVLIALIGVVIVGSIVVGGLQYISSGDKPDAVAAARKRITQALIALLIYMLLFAFMQFLIPGGIL